VLGALAAAPPAAGEAVDRVIVSADEVAVKRPAVVHVILEPDLVQEDQTVEVQLSVDGPADE
jgi:hypothetical protein